MYLYLVYYSDGDFVVIAHVGEERAYDTARSRYHGGVKTVECIGTANPECGYVEGEVVCGGT